MKKPILITLFTFISLLGYSQSTKECADNPNPEIINATPKLEANHVWVYGHGIENPLEKTLGKTGEAVFEENQPTPTTIGNASETVLKIVRGNERASSGIHLFTPNYFDNTKGVLKFRIFPECNSTAEANVKIRVRKDHDKPTQISYKTIKLKENQWNEVEIDLSSSKTKKPKADSLFNQIMFMFNHYDKSAGSNGAIFYIDAVQVPKS